MKKIYYNPFRKLRLLLTAGCLLLTTLVVAQNQPITLSMPASPLSKIFAELQQQSGLSFVYNAGESFGAGRECSVEQGPRRSAPRDVADL